MHNISISTEDISQSYSQYQQLNELVGGPATIACNPMSSELAVPFQNGCDEKSFCDALTRNPIDVFNTNVVGLNDIYAKPPR